jgi:ADP-ribosylglycohydrolase
MKNALAGAILGTAVGDAMGLPFEGLPPRRVAAMLRKGEGYRFLFGRGMVSDDTEHTVLSAEALIESAGDAERFTRVLAGKLRFWLLGLPAGIGYATLRSCVKLWLGIPPERSGVRSAGNGPAMRAPILGAYAGSDYDLMRKLVRASTRLTHTDPRAEMGALAAALAAKCSAESKGDVPPADYIEALGTLIGGEGSAGSDLIELVNKAKERAEKGDSLQSSFPERGVSGYIFSTVPAVLQAWFTFGRDFRSGIIELIRCGGDADTAAAILGGIIGAGVGKEGIPAEWLEGLWEWPRSVPWMEALAETLDTVHREEKPQKPPPMPAALVPLRNAVFMGTVLYHGFRRMIPLP